MTDRMYRMQILLEPEQRRRLEELAQHEQRTISDLTRRVIWAGIRSIETDDDIRRRRRQALARLSQIREQSSRRYGVYAGDLVGEGRDERDE